LAENWSIDIAHELEEYLAELEHISFSFDGVSRTLNFAEGFSFSSSSYKKDEEGVVDSEFRLITTKPLSCYYQLRC